MTFAAPWMLWSLAALLPLVAVYLLKVRPRKRPTTAYFLWEKIFHERRSNRLWHRLRSLWSLLLMAAAFGAIALALAEPRWSDADRQDLLILIDNSASMQASEGGQSRLEIAKEQARDLARALDGVQRAAVATVADRLRYESHLTDNPRELIAAIDSIEPTYEAFRAAALPAGRELTAEEEPAAEAAGGVEEADDSESVDTAADEPPADGRRVLLVTDGVLGGVDPPDGVELILVGGEQPNVGLVAVDLAFVPGSATQMSFYYQVASTFTETTEVDLVLSREDAAGGRQLAKVIPLEVAPGRNAPQVLTVEGAEPGRWVAELDTESVDDALAADDTAWVVARRPPPIRIAVASDDTYFFQASVQAFAGAASALELVESGAEVAIAKGAGDAPRQIVFQPAGESPWWRDLDEDEQAELDVGAVKVLVEDHPLLRHLDPFSINFLGARPLTAPPGSEVLVAADNGAPLIYVAKRSGEAAVVVNLDPVAAEFYFSAWFPVLVHSAAKHLAGREDPLLAVYRPGDSVALSDEEAKPFGELIDEVLGDALPQPADLPETVGDAVAFVLPPDGAPEFLSELKLDRLPDPGFYRVTSPGEEWTVAVSQLAEAETMINANRQAPPPASLASGGPPGGWFILLALLAATAESVLYHRRKVG